MKSLSFRLISGILGFAFVAAAQTFEVASIRPSPPGNGVRGGCRGIDSKYGPDDTAPPLGRCVITDGRLSHLIMIAWQLNEIAMIRKAPKMEKSRDDEVTSPGPFTKHNPTVAISARRYSMAMFTSFLSTFGPGAVKDETGLQDFYDINLTWNEKEGPTLFTALQQQTGLRLESRKVPVSYFAIDSAQRPGDN